MHRSATIQAYQLNKGGTPARMAILRTIAADSVNNRNPYARLQPGDWRKARSYKLNSYESVYGMLGQGSYNKTAVWYSHNGAEFRNERDVHTINRHLYHGWYTDTDTQETAIGIVSGLSHGRFIAGYRWTSNDERIYFPEVFTDETGAARMADEHARVFAESAQEHSERFDAMQKAEIDMETAIETLRDCLVLRHACRRDSEDCQDAVQSVRDARDTLASATVAYERG